VTRPSRFYNTPLRKRPDALRITISPAIYFHWELSGDGKYVTIIPDQFLEPGEAYTLRVRGRYVEGGVDIGNLTVGGRVVGEFEREFRFGVKAAGTAAVPMEMGDEMVTALEWTRLAVSVPPMLPSLNQIGFDYMHWLLAPVRITPTGPETGELLLWAVGARRDANGELVVDPETDFRLPLSGQYQNDAFILSNRDFKMAVTGIPIPFNLFQLRGRLWTDGRVHPDARAYAETEVLTIPTFGLPMVVAGLANGVWRKLVALATYITRPYPVEGTANRRPSGVTIGAVTYRPATARTTGEVAVVVQVAVGTAYSVEAHLGGILLIVAAGTAAVPVDYHANLRQEGDEAGNLARIILTLPAGTAVPPGTTAVVILDAFPMQETVLQ
jgi:hypothetical protein